MPDTVASPTRPDRSASQHARAFQQVLREVFGVPFALYDPAGGTLLAFGASDPAPRRETDAATVTRLAAAGQALAAPAEGNCFRVSLVLHAAGAPAAVAVGFVPALAESAANLALEQQRLQAWARDFSERLRLRDQLAVHARAEEDLREQANAAWKLNLTLGECMRRLRFSRHELRDRQRVLQSALQLLDAQALLWLPVRPGQDVLVAGESPLAAEGVARLAKDLEEQPEAQGPEPYLCNDPERTPWRACCPQIDSLLAFRVTGPAGPAWVVALNKYGRAGARKAGAAPQRGPFRTGDAALLSPFVSLLGMHARAAGKFDELRSLLVGLARSLTAAVDAKDAYTAGHSERVARMAVEIGRELALPEEQVSDTYLAGLLHDVGKIGVRESVLCKPSELSADEREHMKLHVTIGHRILQDLQPIRHLLPGVLYHHERIDGKGYPEGLAGERIPFLARLIAVADCYDAMHSQRPYRPALSPAQVLERLQEGAGTQWDARIVAAAVRCSNRLADISQRGLGESLRQAVDDALRSGGSSVVGAVLSE